MNKYTSLKFSKWLQDNGFDKGTGDSTDWSWYKIKTFGKGSRKKPFYWSLNIGWVGEESIYEEKITAYNILNDLCVRYGKELFGEKLSQECVISEIEITCLHCEKRKKNIEFVSVAYKTHARVILSLLQQNKKDEAELYIRKHSILNPKNKNGKI